MARHDLLLLAVQVLAVFLSTSAAARTVTVFGATSGVGQLIARKALTATPNAFKVNAISRSAASATQWENLAGCNLVECDARDGPSIPPACLSAEQIVISIGTTAFPTKKWEDGRNTPKIACLDSVENILDAIDKLPRQKRPKRVTLISSIGVERSTSFPFLILNRYGVLDYKLQSEELLLQRSAKSGYEACIIRPGRLVGEPFTNLDLAKLLKLNQGNKRAILVDREDKLAGDMERADVASIVVKLFDTKFEPKVKAVRFSVINAKGDPPSADELKSLLTAVQQ